MKNSLIVSVYINFRICFITTCLNFVCGLILLFSCYYFCHMTVDLQVSLSVVKVK